MTAERSHGIGEDRPTPTSPCFRFLEVEGLDKPMALEVWAMAVVRPGAEGFVDRGMDARTGVSQMTGHAISESIRGSTLIRCSRALLVA